MVSTMMATAMSVRNVSRGKREGEYCSETGGFGLVMAAGIEVDRRPRSGFHARANCLGDQLGTRETDRDSARCAHNRNGDARHYLCWRHHLLGPLAQCFFECGPCVLDVHAEAAAGRLGWICWPNSTATAVGVRKEHVLAAAWNGKAWLERPAENLGAPGLGCRGVGARELGMRDPAIEPTRRHMTRGRRFPSR